MTIFTHMPESSMGYLGLLKPTKLQGSHEVHNLKPAIGIFARRKKVSPLQEVQINHTNFPSIHLSTTTTIFPKLERDGSHVKPQCHSGRTDENGGHRDLFNSSGLGPYHYHHTLGPHFPCCKSGLRQGDTYIINPYTGKQINLGKAYVYQGEDYFSINLVAQALTVWDSMGASLSLLPTFPQIPFDAGGSFSACNKGTSSSESGMLGERFSFTYPSNILGFIQNNTLFHANGNRSSKLELLCHTSQAELDPYICYAYIRLDTLRTYMLSGGFFTEFSPDNENIWRFDHTNLLIGIISPQEGNALQVGKILRVGARIPDVSSASLMINDQIIEEKTGLSGNEVTFNDYLLESKDAGNLRISVDARNGRNAEINIPIVTIQVASKLYIITFDPNGGSVEPTSISVPQGSQVGSLPTPLPSNPNHIFAGWFNISDTIGGIKVTSSFIVNENITLFARWQDAILKHMMDNLANDTTIPVDVERRNAMVTMGQVLLNADYEPAFVAGMLGNIQREGSFGLFESSDYVSNPSARPEYFQYFIDNHDYGNRFSGKQIHNIDVTPQELYRITSNSPNQTNIFGLGIAQWTHVSRFFPLVNLYINATGDSERQITRNEVVEAETQMMVQELREDGTHGSIYQDWKTENSSALNSENAAYDAGHRLCLRYLIPSDAQTKAVQRGNDARVIYRIMMS